jgi:hypothetical protein
MNNRKKKNKQPMRSKRTITAPTSKGVVLGRKQLNMGMSNGVCTIEHCEPAFIVAGTTSLYSATKTMTCPGNSDVFPWLSPIALQFEKYHFEYLEYYYEPITSTNQPGALVIQFDPNVDDSKPTSIEEAMQSKFSVLTTVWNRASLKIPGKDLHDSVQWPYTNRGLTPDSHFAAVGRVHVVTDGMASTANIGYVWCRYRVRLKNPQVKSTEMCARSLTCEYVNVADQTCLTMVPTAIAIPQPNMTGLGVTKSSTSSCVIAKSGWYQLEGGCSFINDTAEAFETVLEIKKDGVAFTDPIIVSSDGDGAALQEVEVSGGGIQWLNEGETVALWATLTGAAGTLKVLADTARLLIKSV